MKRASIVILIALVAAVAARVAEPAHQRQAGFSAALACGVERWSVKTLKDRPTLLRARATTVAHLVSLPRPTTLPATRMPFERRIYTVVAAVTLDRAEADLDHHYVLRVGQQTMIAEAPVVSLHVRRDRVPAQADERHQESRARLRSRTRHGRRVL